MEDKVSNKTTNNTYIVSYLDTARLDCGVRVRVTEYEYEKGNNIIGITNRHHKYGEYCSSHK